MRLMARKTKIDDYISGCSPDIASLLEDLRNHIHATLPGTTDDMQYGVPIFINAHGVPVIYLFGSKTHVNFGFLKSAKLSDPMGVLKGSGKPSKHIRVVPGEPVDKTVLNALVKQCKNIVT